MRKLLSVIALLASLQLPGAFAETEIVDGIEWTYIVSGGAASLGYYFNDSITTAVPSETKGAITIPASLGGYPVTSIGDSAFYGCSGLTSVKIPDSVTSIGDEAFRNCRGLTSVTIPAGVTSIEYYAFEGCSGLTSVTIPDSVTSIGSYAFRDCSGLTSVKIPDSVTSIGECAFFGCSGLRSVTIPDSVTSIGRDLFSGCSGLTSVTIPDSVTSIGSSAFRYCSGLTSLTIPDSVIGIEADAFFGCSGLMSILVGSGNVNYRSVNGLLLSEDDKKLVQGVNGDVVIPNSVTSIEYCAFSGRSGLTSVTIPDSVTSIGSSAFRYCSGLTSVTIPDSVTSIGSSAFEYCNVAFYDTTTIPGVKLVDGWVVDNNSPSGDLDLTGVRGIAGSAFSGCRSLTSVTIPDSVTSIGSSAFQSCSGLTSVAIPDSVTSIGSYAFRYCSGLTSITIPDSVTSIGDYAFYNCRGLTSVTIGNSVTNIGSSAFSRCSGLTSVTIPDSVTSIGSSAFFGCSGLTSVKIPDSVTNIGSYAFRMCEGLTSVKIPDSVTSIGRDLFSGCSGLTSVTIPDSVTSIGAAAFSGCSGLTSVKIPDSVTSIGAAAFEGCSGLTSVTIPDSVTSIGSSALYNCSGLTSITIPDSVTSIGSYAFEGCSGLTTVLLPKRFRGTGNWGISSSAAVFYYDRFTAIVQDRRIEAEDAGESSIELLATNTCRVTFDWKCSCEPRRKGRMYDYLAFSIDGVRQEAICGEVGWTNQTYVIEGAGEHVLKWIYTKDESGAEGEDCGWIRCVSIAAPVTLTFLPGGADGGEAPAAMSFYQDDGTVSLPRQGTLAWPKHAFLGWSDGETVFKAGADYPCDAEATTLTATWERKELAAPVVKAPATFCQGETATVSISAGSGAAIHYTLDGAEPTTESPLYTGPFAVSETATVRAIAVRDDYFDSPEATFTTTKDATTFGDAVNCPFLGFAPDDGTGWRLVRGESPDGWALRSGVVSHSQTSRVETVVSGEGIVTFSCKVAGEVVKGDVYDGLAFLVDGVQQGELAGNADWTTKSVSIAGDGEHTLSWLYVKDESDDETVEGDCAWLDEVSWVSTRTVTVALDANGGVMGEAADALRVRANEPVGELPAPVREGWTFLGWYTAAEGGERITAETVIPNDATLYAQWERIFLSVAFDANGGSCGTESVSVAYGKPIGTLPDPSRDDYIFIGWFAAAEGGERVAADAVITESMTLYAQWRCLFEGAWTQGADGVWSSDETADDAENPLTMTVTGAGTLAFRWKVSCEDYFVFRTQKILCDHLSFRVDETEYAVVNAETDWAECSFEIEGDGVHTLVWAYVKDAEGKAGEDRAWLADVVWTPAGPTDVVVEAGGGKTVTVPGAWLSSKTARAATDAAANGRKVWECYVLGLDPEDADSDFKITAFSMKADGTPDLERMAFSPAQTKWNVPGASPVIQGCATLKDGNWQAVTEDNMSSFRFFRVTVALP